MWCNVQAMEDEDEEEEEEEKPKPQPQPQVIRVPPLTYSSTGYPQSAAYQNPGQSTAYQNPRTYQNAGQSAAYQNAGSYQNAGFLQNAGYAQSLALQQSMMSAHAQSMAQRAGFGALPQNMQVRCGVALCFSCLDNRALWKSQQRICTSDGSCIASSLQPAQLICNSR